MKKYITEAGKPSKELITCKDCRKRYTADCPMVADLYDEDYCSKGLKKKERRNDGN